MSPPEPRTERFEIRLRPSELNALTMLAESEDVPVAHLVRTAIRAYLEAKEQER